ncbi:misacylated tRNA(Ala) deacylase [Aliiroseovarius crassostreae]|uniref:Alanyl-transfer RNA synthetases family profile domain-containing protein n=1 Tax=Aliiroseovarius crassostreae TaxID=154981 RepID=A0A0P7JQA8_9RHOB|nr:alanyl-tRNA editing protein [Aliiroseovarius crassostreae]KPN63548.1 hypothetical protein AKJ29_13000 [Aliiroseovarius crassostreae]SFU91920.1 misacylated tRNA(Ala) deacylase [Aliiroseovarius crassostreae]
MQREFYIENPETFVIETAVQDALPGRVLLANSPFYPGGGGQLPDQGWLDFGTARVKVNGFSRAGAGWWVNLEDENYLASGDLIAEVDTHFRESMRQVHTATHVLNAVIFREFENALVTGVQMYADKTARMDFNLPDVDNNKIRALEPTVNNILAQDHKITDEYIDYDAAELEPGLIRSQSAVPPRTPDNKLRIVNINEVDRQACGGTHLRNTSDCPPISIVKIENKGRQNRRVKISIAK